MKASLTRQSHAAGVNGFVIKDDPTDGHLINKCYGYNFRALD